MSKMSTSWDNYNVAEYFVPNTGCYSDPIKDEDSLVYNLLKSCELRGLWPTMKDERYLSSALAAELAMRPPDVAERILDVVLEQAAIASDLRLSSIMVVPLSGLAVLGLLDRCASSFRYRQVLRAAVSAAAACSPHPATLAAAGRALTAARPRRPCALRRPGVRRLALALALAAQPALNPELPCAARADMLTGLAALLRDTSPELRVRLMDTELAEAAARAAVVTLRTVHDALRGRVYALVHPAANGSRSDLASAGAAATLLLAEMTSGPLGERHRLKRALVAATPTPAAAAHGHAPEQGL